MMVQTGAADVVIAGGVESMSNIEYYTHGHALGLACGLTVFTTGSTAGANGRSPRRASAASAA